MTVVAVDPGVLGTPHAPAALAALADEIAGHPALFWFEGHWPAEIDDSTRTALAHLPVLSVAVGCPDPAVAAACDVAAADSETAQAFRRGFESTPFAAVSAALLLRSPARDTWAGLVAESTTYSLLQSGREFDRWLAGRCPSTADDADSGRVRVERRGPVHEVVLIRGARHNALDARMRDELHTALRDLAAGSGPIVLRGEGPSFCSGGDLAEFGTAAGPVPAHVVRLTRSVAMLMSELAARLVVGVHGACIGAGIELPAFASHVVAADDARFSLPELSLGLVPGAGGTVSLRRRIGSARVLDLLLAGRTIGASTARDWGLVDDVVPGRDLEDRVYAIAKERA
jgi:enoyl-CoA hydratase/carnithine racemase